jgi:hypothetical protein
LLGEGTSLLLCGAPYSGVILASSWAKVNWLVVALAAIWAASSFRYFATRQ